VNGTRTVSNIRLKSGAFLNLNQFPFQQLNAPDQVAFNAQIRSSYLTTAVAWVEPNDVDLSSMRLARLHSGTIGRRDFVNSGQFFDSTTLDFVVDPVGNILLAWIDPGGSRPALAVRYRHSRDEWRSGEVIGQSGLDQLPALAINPSGDVLAVWRYATGGIPDTSLRSRHFE